MDAQALICRLELLPAALPNLLAGVSADDARWKPPSGNWSIIEIVNHLVDEEALDFRTRIDCTLCDPQKDWPKIDPEGWAREKRYNERNLADSVSKFISERGDSLQYLRWLRSPDWSRVHTHPKFGGISAGTLLASWAAHDALHLRQLAKRLFELSERDAGEHTIDYAGEWRA